MTGTPSRHESIGNAVSYVLGAGIRASRATTPRPGTERNQNTTRFQPESTVFVNPRRFSIIAAMYPLGTRSLPASDFVFFGNVCFYGCIDSCFLLQTLMRKSRFLFELAIVRMCNICYVSRTAPSQGCVSLACTSLFQGQRSVREHLVGIFE